AGAPALRSTVQAQDGPSGSLSVMGFSLPDEVATVRVDHFQELYPDIELNITEGGLDQQQFLTAVASGNAPDVVYMSRELISTYAVRGALTPLEECIESQAVDLSQYRQAALEQLTIDGELYGLPEFFNVIMVMANTAALEEAGLTIDDVDISDWESIAELNDALTKMEDGLVTRIGFDPKLPEFLPLWAAANGVSLISEDGRTPNLNDPAVVEALEFTVGLHEAAGGRQDFMAFRDTWDFFGSNNMFVQDQLGVFPMEQWYVNVLSDVSPDAPVDFIPFTDREGNPISYVTGNSWAIPTGSSNPEAACAFMKAMTEADAWIAAAEERARLRSEAGTTNTGIYSANVVADEVIFGEIIQPSGNEKLDKAIAVAVEAMDGGFGIPANPAGSEFRQAWQDAVNRVLNGEQSAQEALDQAQAEAQAAFDEAWMFQD
ncbi:MAG: extracellular solute-binding protein, partial [Chloroflexi bacterium]|nr:extracellular solute-binding protein [Chloroflexota bacterium]